MNNFTSVGVYLQQRATTKEESCNAFVASCNKCNFGPREDQSFRCARCFIKQAFEAKQFILGYKPASSKQQEALDKALAPRAYHSSKTACKQRKILSCLTRLYKSISETKSRSYILAFDEACVKAELGEYQLCVDILKQLNLFTTVDKIEEILQGGN